jgi:phage-related minor tail protein
MTASANGNVFAGGNVIPFARGGVVSGPTIFPMANGMGLMGEAGPEAVMPLKRNSRGQLGVVAQGAMPVVRGGNVTIINNGRPVDAKTEQDRDGNWTITLEDVADQVEGVMAKKVGSRRGPMASAIGSSFGIQQNGALVG